MSISLYEGNVARLSKEPADLEKQLGKEWGN
jgi:hypothetical protein